MKKFISQLSAFVFIGFVLIFGSVTLADNYNFSGGTGGGGGAVSSVSNSDGTLTISPTVGGVVASLAALANGKILIGNGSNLATAVTPSGDVTTTNAGVFTIKTDVALAGNPTTTTQAAGNNTTRIATTAFTTTAINNAIAAVNPAVAVTVATTAAGDTSGLTYSNGAAGIGATLTGSVNTPITIDGVTFNSLTQSLLVKNDTQSPSGAFNGVYNVTQLQTGILPPILTRRVDYNQPSDINNTGAIPVTSGTVNASTSWLLTSQVTTVGTDPLTYSQFTVSPTTIQTTTLANGKTWFGNGSNLAVAVTPSGDVTATNAGVFTIKNDVALAGNPTTTTQSVGNSSTRIATTAFVGSAVTAGAPNTTNNFRLTLTTGVPITTSDVTAAGTVYASPLYGNAIALFDGTSTWNTRTSAEMSVATPAFLHRIYDFFVYDNSGTPTVELNAWDSGGQVTGSITGVSIGTTVTVTASNSLTNGDIVFIDGITGTAGTDAKNGLNGKAVVVASATGSNFVAAGMDTTGLAYTSGGTFYRVPTARTDALALQNGIYVKASATTRRYLGSFMTVASAQTEDSLTRRLVFSYNNRVERRQLAKDTTVSWAYASATLRAKNNNTAPAQQRSEILIGLVEDVIHAYYNDVSAPNGDMNDGIGINSCTVNSADRGYTSVAYGGGLTTSFDSYPNLGYDFVQLIESSPSAASRTFLGYGAGTQTLPRNQLITTSRQ